MFLSGTNNPRAARKPAAARAAAAAVLMAAALIATPATALVPPLELVPPPRPDFQTMQWPAPPRLFAEVAPLDVNIPGVTTPAPVADSQTPAPKKEQPPAQPQQKAAKQQPQPKPKPAALKPNMPASNQPPKKKPDVTIKGYRYLRMRNMSSSGNSSRFLSMSGLAYQGAKLEQGTDLSLVAKTTSGISLTGKFTELPRQDREMMFNLGAGDYSLMFGDLVASFKGGEFSPFSKKITGVEFDYKSTNSYVQVISSQSKSQSHTETFTGRNIKGPYDLGANDLILESIAVKLNGVPIGTDRYMLDAFQGEITFYEVIGPGDTVVVTYEQRLRGALSEGNVIGFAAGRSGKRWSAGFSHLVQQANTSAESVQKSVTDEQATLSGDTLSVSKGFIVRTSDVGSETITKVTGSGSLVLVSGLDYNQGLTVADRMELYRNGRFKLSAPDPTAKYLVSYNYYSEDDNIIQFQSKEFLSPLGSVATLSRQTVYYGSEDISVCYDATLDTVRVHMIRGVDYDIDEGQNRIILKNYQAEPYLRADYWFYPSASVASTAYDHMVQGYTLGVSPVKGLNVGFEAASSRSDLSNKPIQVLGEAVSTVQGALNCDAGFIRQFCTFQLAHKNIIRGSQMVYFNDRLAPSNILPSDSVSYVMDASRGTVEIKVTIPAGTTIYVDYRYLPEREPGLADGNVNQMKADFRHGGTSASYSMKNADTAFTPIGGENNMETSRRAWTLAHKFSGALSFTADGLDSDTAADLEETHKTTSSQANYAVKWAPGTKMNGLTLDLGWKSRSTSDDYSVHLVDTSDREFSLAAGSAVPFLRDADFSLGLSNRNSESRAGTPSFTDTRQRRFGFNWKPMAALKFGIARNSSALTNGSASDTFTTTNLADNFNLTWYPIKLLTLGATVDKQSTKDSRPGNNPSRINKNMFRIDTKPFGRVNFVSFVKTQDDHPSVNTPSSHSDTMSLSTSIKVSPSISVAPSMNRMDSSFGEQSSSHSDNKSLALEYRPPGRPFSATLTTDRGKLNSTGASFSTSSRISRNKLTLGYNPSTVWGYSATASDEKNRSSSGRGDDFGLRNLNLRVKHNPSPATAHWFIFSDNSRTGGQGTGFTTYEFGLDHKLTQDFRWDLLLRRSNYSDRANAGNSFSGNLVESSLRIEF